jgi:hypothetical protein
MEKSIYELKEEARSLGLSFKENISKVELSKMIEEAKVNAKSEPEKTEVVVETAEDIKRINLQKRKQRIAEAKKEAERLVIANITSTDPNVASEADYAEVFGFESPTVSISKAIPLGVNVEIPQCLVNVARGIKRCIHVPSSHPDKLTEPRLVPKYNVQIVRQ